MDVNVRASRTMLVSLREGQEDTIESNKVRCGRQSGLIGGPSRARTISKGEEKWQNSGRQGPVGVRILLTMVDKLRKGIRR